MKRLTKKEKESRDSQKLLAVTHVLLKVAGKRQIEKL